MWAVQQAPSKDRRRFPTMWTRLPPCRTRRLPRTLAHTTGNFPSPLGKTRFQLPRRRSSFRFTTERTRNSAMGKRIGWSASPTAANGRCSNISRIRRGTTSGSSRPRTPRASTASTRSIIMGRKHSRKATTVMGIRLMGRRTMRSLILGRFEGERSRLFYK